MNVLRKLPDAAEPSRRRFRFSFTQAAGAFVLGALLLGTIDGRNAAAADETPRKIVLIAGKKSHGPEGNGLHDYPWSVKLLKVMLDNSNVRDKVRVEYHLNGWPQDESTLNDAHSIMVISDGRDGNLYEEAPHFQTPERVAVMRRHMARGCGFATFHFSTFAPDQYADEILEWSGAYFDWETEGKREWYSAIKTIEADVQLATPDHPVARGLQPFRMKEEFYYNLRFHPGDTALKPLWTVPSLDGREPDGRVVAWARERKDGGRGFGTTCGHFYDNWKQAEFRKLILNALCWTAKVEVPEGGVVARFYERDEVTAALADVSGAAPAIVDDQPIRVLMLAGNEAHKWHNWERTSIAIQRALEKDRRVRLDITLDPEDFARKPLGEYHVLIPNYVNWHDPKPLSEAARKGLLDYLAGGGGLIFVHFSSSAWHFSLPMAKDSDWPEYRKIARRVWNHNGEGERKSGHDAFGLFTVRPTGRRHPIVDGLNPFEVVDELYFRQDGEEPIESLIHARSKVTNRDEPLAWAYTYGKSRVFQTLLGHSEKTYEAFEPREMLRRATAWCANRALRPLEPADDPSPNMQTGDAGQPAKPNSPTPAPTKPERIQLVDGKFRKALDTRGAGVLIAARDEYRQPPLTLDFWTRLRSKSGYNILVAQELKSSATHWEIFSLPASGKVTVYLPGYQPDHVNGSTDIADDRWHYVGMIFEPNRVRLFVDGKLVADQAVRFQNRKTEPGGLAIGQLVAGELGCDGLIDEVRLTRGVRDLSVEPPSEAPATDDQTIGLWRFDTVDGERQSPDASSLKNGARLSDLRRSPPGAAGTSSSAGSAPRPAPKGPDHWGVASVGFAWTEQDSVDDRWNETDVGPFLASIVPLPDLPPVRKGLSVRVGPTRDGTVCFDTQRATWRAAWLDGFLKFHPARYGLIQPPTAAGSFVLATGEGVGWPDQPVQYKGLHLSGDRVVLSYDVARTRVRESPWLERRDGRRVFVRTLEVQPHGQALRLRVVEATGDAERLSVASERAVAFAQGPRSLALGLACETAQPQLPPDPSRNARPATPRFEVTGGKSLDIVLAPSDAVVRFALCMSSVEAAASKVAPGDGGDRVDPSAEASRLARQLAIQFAESRPAEWRDEWLAGGPSRWTAPLVTTGERAEDSGPYVVDTLTLPEDNPYRALLFASGHDFFSNGDMAVSTVHGDVWRVSGVDANLARLSWRRFATGLFQPLGLRIVNDVVHVLGRDQITRLHDLNADGEADHYENFCNRLETSAGGHDYVTCLETDSQGNFYFLHANQGIVRVSADGTRTETLATGLRNPNGLGVGPDGTVTVAPQEGEWTPASGIFAIHPGAHSGAHSGAHFGYGGPRVTAERPLGYDPPLCWIPRFHDNSSGGQVWVTSDRWGPLAGQLLHLSYGKCRLMLVPRDTTAKQPQAATLDFPFDFSSGAMRGRFSPHDGQLYVSGLKGWVTSAVLDGCLQRVRYTGRPVTMPVAFETFANGLLLRFTAPLDAETAHDPDNYRLQQWNYRYSAEYGSDDWKLSDPKQVGHDDVDVASATLLEDGRAVFLEIPALRPVMQMSIEYQLKARDGTELRHQLFPTLNDVRANRMAEQALVRRPRPGQLPAELLSRLRPGLAVKLAARDGVGDAPSDQRVDRMLAWHVDGDQSPSLRMDRGPFRLTAEGWLNVPLRGTYELGIVGRGRAKLHVNGRSVWSGGGALDATLPVKVELHRGHNELRFEYESRADGTAWVQVLWKSPDFEWEPIPPTLLVHDGGLPGLSDGQEFRRGHGLYVDYRCDRCHGGPGSSWRLGAEPAQPAKPADEAQPRSDAPRLAQVGRRLQSEWLYQWLLDPRSVRSNATMPRLLTADRAEDRQTAADLVAFLTQGLPKDGQGDVKVREGRRAESQQEGERVYEDLGCIGCHRLTPHAELDEFQRLSLHGVANKFRAGALEAHLLRPHEFYAASRMPDFRLSAQEAAEIAEFLEARRSEPAEPAEPADATKPSPQPVGDVARGRTHFLRLGCGRCHESPDPALVELGRPLPIAAGSAERGCLSEAVRGATTSTADAARDRPRPHWQFTDGERAALRRYVAQGVAVDVSAERPAVVEQARHAIERLNCAACHNRDDRVSPLRSLIADESSRGIVPESLPNLTWAGEKLNVDWLERFLRGEITERPRPWLKARMPAFPAAAQVLAHGLAAQHGLAAIPKSPRESNVELQQLGRRLVATAGGLDCRQCHAVGPEKPTGDERTQIALGINFAQVGARLRYDYYRRFMLDPPRYDVTTRMPKLAPDGRTTKVRGIFGGDAKLQFEAIWAFIKQVEQP